MDKLEKLFRSLALTEDAQLSDGDIAGDKLAWECKQIAIQYSSYWYNTIRKGDDELKNKIFSGEIDVYTMFDNFINNVYGQTSKEI